MFQKLIVLATISLSLTALAGRSPGTYFQAKNDLQKISTRNLSDTLNQFVKASAPSRMVGLPGHERARSFIMESIQKSDPKSTGKLSLVSKPVDTEAVKAFYQKDFDEKVEGKIPKGSPDYQKWLRFTSYMKNLVDQKKSYQVENIVWEKTGLNSNKVLVVTAHYDTISHDKNTLMVKENEAMPGANYNATGVAIALNLVKVMSDFDLNYTVQVVFLDWQGLGFHGSELYAKELKRLKDSGKDIMGVVNLEMLGQDTSYFDKTKKTGNMSLYLRDLGDEKRFAQKLVDHGSKMTQKVTFEIKPNGFESSDNIRFWEQGFTAVTFSQNWEDDFNPKFYQTAQDTPETLNHDTFYHAYQYVGGGVLGILLDITK